MAMCSSTEVQVWERLRTLGIALYLLTGHWDMKHAFGVVQLVPGQITIGQPLGDVYRDGLE